MRAHASLRSALLVFACIHLASTALTGTTFIRSAAFTIGALCAVWLVIGANRLDSEPIPPPEPWLWGILVAWAGWCAASCLWSIDPAYSRSEFVTEVLWGLMICGIYYTAARDGGAV